MSENKLDVTGLNAIVSFAGVGGVGKTSVVNLLQQAGAKVFPSVTRPVHLKWGIHSEADATKMSLADFDALQADIRATYIQEGLQFIHSNPEGLLIFDRSLADHTSYRAVREPYYQSAGAYEELLTQLRTYYQMVTAYGRQTLIIEFPFPVPWSTDDGWRYSPHSKNAIWQLMLSDHLKRLDNGNVLQVQLPHATVEARAREVEWIVSRATATKWQSHLHNKRGALE